MTTSNPRLEAAARHLISLGEEEGETSVVAITAACLVHILRTQGDRDDVASPHFLTALTTLDTDGLETLFFDHLDGPLDILLDELLDPADDKETP